MKLQSEDYIRMESFIILLQGAKKDLVDVVESFNVSNMDLGIKVIN